MAKPLLERLSQSHHGLSSRGRHIAFVCFTPSEVMVSSVAVKLCSRAKVETSFVRVPPNERCSCQALFGCGFAAMVILCSQLN